MLAVGLNATKQSSRLRWQLQTHALSLDINEEVAGDYGFEPLPLPMVPHHRLVHASHTSFRPHTLFRFPSGLNHP
jgi:hypothetical protein